MSLPQSQPNVIVEEYLNLERESEERHEYLDGQIYAMAGESEEHGDICVNIVGELRTQLRGRPCRVWTKDVKVRSGPTPEPYQTTRGLFSYPDVVSATSGNITTSTVMSCSTRRSSSMSYHLRPKLLIAARSSGVIARTLIR